MYHPAGCRDDLSTRRLYFTLIILLYLEEAASATWPPEGVMSDEAGEENGEQEQDGEET